MIGVIALVAGGVAALGLGSYFASQPKATDVNWNDWMPYIIGGTVITVVGTAAVVVAWQK